MPTTVAKSTVKVTTTFGFIRRFPVSRENFKTVNVNKGIMEATTEDIVQFAADNGLVIHGDYLKHGEVVVGQIEVID